MCSMSAGTLRGTAIWRWSSWNPSPGDVSPFDQANGDTLERFNFVHLLHDMTKDDKLRLARLIENHRHYTGSERAKAVIENWANYLPKFVKVMPVEYRKAMEAMKPRH